PPPLGLTQQLHQVQPLTRLVEEGRPGRDTRHDVNTLIDRLLQTLSGEKAHVLQQQGPRGQGLAGDLGHLLVVQASQQRQFSELPRGDLGLQDQFDGGGLSVRAVTSPPAGKEGGQTGGQGDQGAVPQEDGAEATQQGQQGGPYRVEGIVEGVQEEVAQEGGGLGSETLVKGLGGDGGVQAVGAGVGKIVEGRSRLLQQGEDQGLGEDRPGELAVPLAETGIAGQPVGGVQEEVVQGRVQLGYTQHGEAPGSNGLWQNHLILDLPSLKIRKVGVDAS